MKTLSTLLQKFYDGTKKFVPLIDPDKYTPAGIARIGKLAEKAKVPFLFYGGSLLTTGNHEKYIGILKEECSSPVVLFPGNNLQINNKADGLLLLSLISGRNPEMLIGRHVVAAPLLKASGLEILPTGYLLIDSRKPTAVSYMSHSIPIPSDQADIAACTALAGEMLGLKLIYLDAGSGASAPVPARVIGKVKEFIHTPLIVGGGLRSVQQVRKAFKDGADVVVVGNALEKDPGLLLQLAACAG